MSQYRIDRIASWLREAFDPSLDYSDAEVAAVAQRLDALGFRRSSYPTRLTIEQARAINEGFRFAEPDGVQWHMDVEVSVDDVAFTVNLARQEVVGANDENLRARAMELVEKL